ncbi:two-component system, NtrC family, nitrogen regulation sensor histidine kinase GlnL [Palleronia salina]|uniref:histidine kinase n=1 Tax=Palleronia salina TaxID=313368 RepID=A0A1M6B3R6_9RHOB|nr:ATP-binding protein [Palleronia salina]SHI43320.1 two-component system, NtrC family, nitrogen regulation sensor histidine kinase GlnL [Palleronia salina]
MSADLSAVLWASIPVPVLLVDQDDMIAEANSEAEDFLMASARSLRGQPLFDRISVDSPLDEAFERVRSNRAALYINNVDVSGGNRPPENCNLQIAPLQGVDGGLLVMMTPRQMAGRLSNTGSVKSSARSAIGMAEMLAHEIKNPLAGITGAAQLLSMNLTNGDLQLTDLIVAESRRIVALVNQFEEFGNLRPPQRSEVNIHDITDRALRTAGVSFAAHMRLVQNYDPSLPATFVDADQIQQVFLNLIRNAAQAAEPDGGTITIKTFYDHALRVRRSDGSAAALPLQVEVIDDGKGLPPELADAVFDPFVSGRENGTGLGLALVSKIISEHDGLITVESHPGRTAFRISLPLAPPQSQKE